MHYQRKVPSVHNHLIECEHVLPSETVFLCPLLNSSSRMWPVGTQPGAPLSPLASTPEQRGFLLHILIVLYLVFLCARYGIRE